MTREQLEEYRSKKEEIAELEYKLKHISDNDEMVGNDVIMDYRSGFPVPQSVVGVDWKKYDNTKARYTNRLAKLREECDKIEAYVESIEDSLIRRIFRMYYIDGMTQDKVAKELHIHRSGISKKISEFLKLSHKSQKTTL